MRNQSLSNLASPSLTQTAMSLITGALFLTLSAGGHAGTIDFSKYDEPLYEQITDHITEHVHARLGKGRNDRERYFIIPFAYQNHENEPEFSHTFISVVRVFAAGSQPQRTRELQTRSYKSREFEAFTVSWLPADFMQNPHLCVFDGFGARLIPSSNKCPLSPGKSFNLQDTIKLAVDAKVAVCMWGPYEISRQGFDLGVKRMRLLNEGKIKYRADDRMYRKDLVAINCFHAVAGIYELFPNGGLFGTGFKMWGINGTARVLIEYTTKATRKHLLLEPVDVKKDRYGFVYAPSKSGSRVYNPFNTASAYRR
jgi:hypothetical protein